MLVTIVFVPDVSTLSIADMDEHWFVIKDNHLTILRQQSLQGGRRPVTVASDWSGDSTTTAGDAVLVTYRGDAVAKHNLSLYERVVRRLHHAHRSRHSPAHSDSQAVAAL